MMKRSPGFTLAELLIALAILGVIATFTIPKVLSSQKDSRNNAIAKEFIATVSAAYEAYKLKNGTSTAAGPQDLTPFMNYVKVDTGSSMNSNGIGTTQNCSAGYPCLRLHNGAIVLYHAGAGGSFGGSATTNAIWFDLDADGKTTATDAVFPVFLYYNGRIKSQWEIDANTCNNTNCWATPAPASDLPPWFSWN